jgi:hypothetical protein
MRKYLKIYIILVVFVVFCFALAACATLPSGGEQPPAGTNGINPHIGDNGNWFIGDTDTGIKAQGATWFIGAEMPNVSLGNNGDLFLYLITNDVYQKTDGVWQKITSLSAQNMFLVTFDTAGLGNLPQGFNTRMQVKWGETIDELPVPVSPFGNFLGWFTTTGGEITINDGQLTTLTAITRNVTVRAMWDAPTHTNDYDSACGDFTFTNITELKKYNGAAADLVLPNIISKIHPTAFAGNTSLVNLQIGTPNIAIPDRFFANHPSLKTVVFAGGATEVGEEAFLNCFNLKTVHFENTRANGGDYMNFSIGVEAFRNCTNLTNVTTNINYVTRITNVGTFAFRDCSSLLNLNNFLIGGVTSLTGFLEIGAQAFAGCVSFVEIEIHGRNVNIGSRAFDGWTNAQTVTFFSVTLIAGTNWVQNSNAKIVHAVNNSDKEYFFTDESTLEATLSYLNAAMRHVQFDVKSENILLSYDELYNDDLYFFMRADIDKHDGIAEITAVINRYFVKHLPLTNPQTTFVNGLEVQFCETFEARGGGVYRLLSKAVIHTPHEVIYISYDISTTGQNSNFLTWLAQSVLAI